MTARIVPEAPEAGDWHLGLEFELPRRQRRVDVVLLANDLVILLEIKARASRFDRSARWQCEQYAMDLRDFHAGSFGRRIVPIVLATNAIASLPLELNESLVQPTQSLRPVDLAMRLQQIVANVANPTEQIEGADWEESSYRATPTIVDAARELYQGHDVREISAADAHNLDDTVDAVVALVEECRSKSRRAIAFITGAPGSGKTLAGLQVVHDERLSGAAGSEGVFLSGNRPLVEVISGALSRTGLKRVVAQKDSARKVSAFVQHAYAFRNEYAENERVPPEHVVLFDEAQRAWDSKQVLKWSQGQSGRSEPAILLDVMSRIPNWSVVIAMIGGGQEINRGEAGLGEWGRALQEGHPDWIVAASPDVLPGSPEGPGGRLFDYDPPGIDVRLNSAPHLTMNVRSPRAERLNLWVDALLSLDVDKARSLLPREDFPLVMTRSLSLAKDWLRDRTDQDHRCGLVASADARRLRAWGLDTSYLLREKAWANWFLNPAGDVRSSYQLEVPATNFDCQGLELDWVGVCWGNDMIVDSLQAQSWRTRQFIGTRWVRANPEKSQYMLNSYRVLLTRARLGQVIWVPDPDGTDATLETAYFDSIAGILQAAGVPSID